MNGKEIKTGETYFFVATDSSARKHLEGTEFTVFEIKHVWRRTFKKSRQVKRFFNEFGEGARAEELEPMDDFDKMVSVVTKTAEAFQAAGNAMTYFSKGERPASDYVEKDDLPF